jgi:hypothetical protein
MTVWRELLQQAHTLSPSMDIVKANTDSMSAMYFCKTILWWHQHCTKPIYNIPKLGDPKCSHIPWARTLALFQNRTWEFQSAGGGISAALGLKSSSSWRSESPAWNRSGLVAAKRGKKQAVGCTKLPEGSWSTQLSFSDTTKLILIFTH